MDQMLHVHEQSLWETLAIAVVFSAVASILYHLTTVRYRMSKLRKQDLPILNWHPVWGSLQSLGPAVSELPSDFNGQYIPHILRRQFPHLGPVFYIDTWPFMTPALVIGSPHAAFQVTEQRSLPKFPELKYFMRPVGGENNLPSMEGAMWKKWRGILNPAFSHSRIEASLSTVIQEVLVFRDILSKKASRNELFCLKDLTDNLAVDVIAAVAIGASFKSQVAENAVVAALRRLIPWLSFRSKINPWQRWHPVRPLIYWYNARIMDQFVAQCIDERWTATRNQEDVKNNSILDIMLKDYRKKNANQVPQSIDSHTKRSFVDQVKQMLFSGQDTVSNTICYIYYMLSKHYRSLERLRSEHNSIFTAEVAAAADMLIESPSLLSKLPFTVAVIKETLRLFPPISSPRTGFAGHTVKEAGLNFPTDEFMVWVSTVSLHRDMSLWQSPDEFIPDRWMVSENHPLYPKKGAYRPYEYGPRNCIGQELAMMEMKLVLILTVRSLNIRACYEEWDALHPRGGIKTVMGERAYMTAGPAAPSENLPCRSTFVQL